MKSLTIRNIPNQLISKLRTLSVIDRRSMNSEILFILEQGIATERINKTGNTINKETQLKIWNKLSGEWKDIRKTEEIIDEIYTDRSQGREFIL